MILKFLFLYFRGEPACRQEQMFPPLRFGNDFIYKRKKGIIILFNTEIIYAKN